jgi:ParB-like chromosome segregation protein Spo0J
MEQNFDLTLIDANPWQPRVSEDGEHIANLAASIAEDGLMQVPTGRMVDDGHGSQRVQLAFGHSRLAAYKLLRDLQNKLSNHVPIDFDDESALARAVAAADRALELGTNFDDMPVHVVELDDESMYRFAVSENIQRRDLSPIETAKAMARYRDEFRKKSAEIGALFGVNDATVRGTLRLLDLPDTMQEKLAAGEMTVGAARKILSVKHLVGDLNELTQDRFANVRTVDEIVRSKIENGGIKLITMWSRWSNSEPRGGDSLWPLSWTYDVPPYSMPTEKEFLKLWNGPEEIKGRSIGSWARDLAGTIITIAPHLRKTWDELYSQEPREVHPIIDLLRQLAEPPACTACTYYVKNDGNHLCALKACWDRKFDRWVIDELQALSKKMGIGAYDFGRDGRAFEKLEEYRDRDTAWIRSKHPDLRLMIKRSSYKHGFTDSVNISVVVVGAEAETIKKADEEKRNNNSTVQWERDRKKYELYQGAVRQFISAQVLPAFAPALDGKLTGGLLDALADRYSYNYNNAELPAAQRIVYGLIWNMSEVNGHARQTDHPTPVHYAAKHLQGVAKAWGVKLPPDWLEIAARYEPDLSEFPECCVSLETT